MSSKDEKPKKKPGFPAKSKSVDAKPKTKEELKKEMIRKNPLVKMLRKIVNTRKKIMTMHI